MTDYYVQLDGDFLTSGRGSGTQGDPYLGPAAAELLDDWNGLGLAAGDVVYMRGTLPLVRLKRCEGVTVTSGAFAAGDLIGNDPVQGSATIVARVVAVPSATTLVIWTDDEINDGFTATNYTQAGQASINADIGEIGLDITVSGDAVSGDIQLLGCPAGSWTPDGSQAALVCTLADDYCVNIDAGYLRIANVTLSTAAGHLLDLDDADHVRLIDCGVAAEEIQSGYAVAFDDAAAPAACVTGETLTVSLPLDELP